MGSSSCTPPRVLAGPEVGLHPRDEEDLAVVDVGVNQGQGLFTEERRSRSVESATKSVADLQLEEMGAFVFTRGAGPRTTLPWLLYWDPWQGQMNLFSAPFHGTTQPR